MIAGLSFIRLLFTLRLVSFCHSVMKEISFSPFNHRTRPIKKKIIKVGDTAVMSRKLEETPLRPDVFSSKTLVEKTLIKITKAVIFPMLQQLKQQ